MEQLALAILVEELRLITRRRGVLMAPEMADLASMLALPVYAGNDDAFGLLLEDLREEVTLLPDPDDAAIARYLFRFEAPDLGVGERRTAAIENLAIADTRQIRGDRENYILAQVAFRLFARATSPDRAGWHHGDGYVFTDFTHDVFPSEPDLLNRTTRYCCSILAVRDRVEFYKFGTTLRGSRAIRPARLHGENQTQQFVASVPVDNRNPSAGHWHIVRFNPKLAFRETPTIVVEEETATIDPADVRRQAGLSIARIDPVARALGIRPRATLRVHLSREVAPHYHRYVYSLSGALMDRPSESERVVRNDDTPMVFRPENVQAGHRYVIDWSV